MLRSRVQTLQKATQNFSTQQHDPYQQQTQVLHLGAAQNSAGLPGSQLNSRNMQIRITRTQSQQKVRRLPSDLNSGASTAGPVKGGNAQFIKDGHSLLNLGLTDASNARSLAELRDAEMLQRGLDDFNTVHLYKGQRLTADEFHSICKMLLKKCSETINESPVFLRNNLGEDRVFKDAFTCVKLGEGFSSH